MFETFASLFSFARFGSSTGWFHFPHADKLVHFSFYFITTVIGFLALKFEWYHSWSEKKKLWLVFTFSVGYGIIIEVLQLTITHDRSGELLDVMANTIGAFCGIFIGKRFSKVNFLRNT